MRMAEETRDVRWCIISNMFRFTAMVVLVLIVATLLVLLLTRGVTNVNGDADHDTVAHSNTRSDYRKSLAELGLPSDLSQLSAEFLCSKVEGGWLAEHRECDLTDTVIPGQEARYCIAFLQGSYSECLSPCRHEPDVQGCIEMCFQVCTVE